MNPIDQPVLFAGRDPKVEDAVRKALVSQGTQLNTVASPDRAVSEAARCPYPAILLDTGSCGADPGRLISSLAEVCPSASFILLVNPEQKNLETTADIDPCIAALVLKPCSEDELVGALQRSLDLHERRQCSATLANALDSAPDPPRLLVIEDDSGHADLVGNFLQLVHAPYTVEFVDNLADALEAVSGAHYDVILSDLSLPDARGLDCVVRLKEVAPTTAVIVLSCLNDEDFARQAMGFGAQDYLVKGRIDPEGLARALDFATEREKATREISELARFDALTGLPNRFSLNNRLRREFRAFLRAESHFSLLYLDLDGFKTINDTLGHDVGDAVLCEFSRRIDRILRDDDMAARVGGDEFVLVLGRTDESSAVHVAQRIIEAMDEAIETHDSKLLLTTSIGIAMSHPKCESVQAMLQSADTAMYEAKRAGRNCYKIARPVTESLGHRAGSEAATGS